MPKLATIRFWCALCERSFRLPLTKVEKLPIDEFPACPHGHASDWVSYDEVRLLNKATHA
jgi:hypothetical protein